MTIKTNPDWEQRLQQIKADCVNPDGSSNLFGMTAFITQGLRPHLSDEERERLVVKMRLVAKAATLMMEEMLKGTVKYSTDRWESADWESQFTEEFLGLTNYRLLMTNQDKLK